MLRALDDAIFRLSHRETGHVAADARIYLREFLGARYLFIKNFISIAYVLAHPLQEINKWVLEFRKGARE